MDYKQFLKHMKSKNLKKAALKIAKKEYGVDVIVDCNLKRYCGYTDFITRKIVIAAKLKPRIFVTTIFHELGHIHCLRNNKYPIYHLKRPTTKKLRRDIKATALRAELYVDKWGETECNKHFPKLKYDRAYRSKKDKKWFNKFLKKRFKEYKQF